MTKERVRANGEGMTSEEKTLSRASNLAKVVGLPTRRDHPTWNAARLGNPDFRGCFPRRCHTSKQRCWSAVWGNRRTRQAAFRRPWRTGVEAMTEAIRKAIDETSDRLCHLEGLVAALDMVTTEHPFLNTPDDENHAVITLVRTVKRQLAEALSVHNLEYRSLREDA